VSGAEGAGADPPWVADAARLFRSLRQAAEEAAGPRAADLLETAGHAPECRACPVCQAVAVLRRSGPDVLDQISAFTAGLAASLRAASASEAEAPAGPPEPAPPEVLLRTERIDVTD
jgi:hypothetical protein